jgi:hypothetical protein
MDEKHVTATAPATSGQEAATNPGGGAGPQGHAQGDNDRSKPRGNRTESTAGGSLDSAAQNAYDQGRRYYREAPLLSLLVVGAVGYVLAWAIHGSQGNSQRAATDRRARSRQESPGQRSGKPLIESDRVEDTAVYDPAGKQIGMIKRLMIEKLSGRVAYAVMSFGGFLGVGADEYAIPWRKLDYDTSLEGYRTNITEEQLRSAPRFSRDRGHDWSDRQSEQELHDYYQVTSYWLVP